MKTLAILITVMIGFGFTPLRVKDVPNRAELAPIVEEVTSEEPYVPEGRTGLERIEEVIDDDAVILPDIPEEDRTGLEPIIEEEISEEPYVPEGRTGLERVEEIIDDGSVILVIPEEGRTGLEPIIEEEISEDGLVEETRDFF